MPVSDQKFARRIEAERLIGLAKAMLSEPEEEIASIYLDHAMDALQAIPAEAGPHPGQCLSPL